MTDTVKKTVEALRYRAEGCGLDYWWCHWKFLLAL